MKSVKTEIRWVVIGLHCLYIGQHLTRNSMIAQHVSQRMLDDDGFEISEFCSGALDEKQKIAWAQCRKLGDRCVKATIIRPVREVKKGKRK